METKRTGLDWRKSARLTWRERNRRWLRFNGRPPRGPALAKRTTTIAATNAQINADTTTISTNPYVLETGEAAAYRLGLLQRLYGPGTCQVLQTAGLLPGMHVADIGCGIGTVTALLGELVGCDGHVTGFDISAAQLAQAQERLQGCEFDFSFVEASATDIKCADDNFDLEY